MSNDIPGDYPGRPGIAVDPSGERFSSTDPSKNVADLVEAKDDSNKALRLADQRYLDAQLISIEKQTSIARIHDNRFQDFAREMESKGEREVRDAETRRIDQLAQTRQEFQNTIRDMLAESVRTTSTLVSTQLVQIQATFDTRVSKLEAQAFTAAGRQSVADPALEGAMVRMETSIRQLASSTSENINRMARENSEALNKLTATVSSIQLGFTQSQGSQKGANQTEERSRAGQQGNIAMAALVISFLGVIILAGSWISGTVSKNNQYVAPPSSTHQSYAPVDITHPSVAKMYKINWED